MAENSKTGGGSRPSTSYAKFPEKRSSSRPPAPTAAARSSSATRIDRILPPKEDTGSTPARAPEDLLDDEPTRFFSGNPPAESGSSPPLVPRAPRAPYVPVPSIASMPAVTPQMARAALAVHEAAQETAPAGQRAREAIAPKPAPAPAESFDDRADEDGDEPSLPPTPSLREPGPESRRLVDGDALPDWQQVWLSTQTRPWQCLGFVPGGKIDGEVMMRVARAFRQIGEEHLKQHLEVLDHTGASLGDVERRIELLKKAQRGKDKVLVVLDGIQRSTVSSRYANVLDAAILVVVLGKSEISVAKKTIEAFGKQRFFGTIVLRKEHLARVRDARDVRASSPEIPAPARASHADPDADAHAHADGDADPD